MKIAIVAPAAIPVRDPRDMGYGGIERLVFHHLKELEKKGHEVTLFAGKGSDAPERELVEGEREEELASKWYLRAPEFDVIHDFSHLKMHGADFGNKTCCTIFYTDSPGGEDWTRLYGSKAVARAFGEEEDGRVIYPGIDPSPYHYSNNKKEDFFLFFNRIMSIKGVDKALQLAKMMRFPLKIAGHDGRFAEAEFAAQIKKQASALKTQGVEIEYLGEVDWETKLDLLSRARALIFPFRWLESFGIIVVEALLSGTPVICANFGGPPEIVTPEEGTGYLCGERMGEWVDAINKVRNGIGIDAEVCRKRGEYFSSKRMSEEYLKVYEEICSSS
jgi:glycosyltransferase involved in cell wall biosynthesis